MSAQKSQFEKNIYLAQLVNVKIWYKMSYFCFCINEPSSKRYWSCAIFLSLGKQYPFHVVLVDPAGIPVILSAAVSMI